MRRVAMIAVLVLAVADAAQAAKPRPLRFGLNDTPQSHADSARAFDLHAQLGSTVVRFGLPWKSVEPRPGPHDWTYPDRLYHSAVGRGMRPIMVIGEVPGWAATRTFARPCRFSADAEHCERPPAPEHLSDFDRFVAGAAARYPKLAAIEVFNEPNLGDYSWQPRADPEYYAQVLRTAHDAVHRVRDDLPVISGGVTGPPLPLTEGMLDPAEFLERLYAAGGKGAMDGIGLHPYPGRHSPGDPQVYALRLLGATRAIRDRNGDEGVPIWITETGYTTSGPSALTLEQQALWLPDLVERLLRPRDIAAVLVNTLADRSGDKPEDGYGITFADLSPKPVFARLTASVERVAERRSAAACRCTRRARSCARRHSRTRSCRKARRRCRCIRRWRRCVKRGSESRACRRARRCARCRKATAAGASCPPQVARGPR